MEGEAEKSGGGEAPQQQQPASGAPDQSRMASESTLGITRMGETQYPEASGPQVDDGTMEEVIEKLKILNYQVDFAQNWHGAKGHNFKPLTKTYFCTPAGNTNEQYFYFSSLVSWLVGLCGGRFDPPDQFDDPNVTATNIIQALKDLNLSVRDIMHSKVRQGYGDSVLLTLVMLCDQALSEKGFQFLAPVYPQDKYDDEMHIGDPTGGGDEGEIEDDVAFGQESEEEEWYEQKGSEYKDDEHTMIESQVNPEAWKLELENVAPLLKLSGQEHMKDWRAHIDWVGSLLKKMEGVLPDVKVSLGHVNEDIQKAVEKIQKREGTIASQFQDAIDKYRSLHKELISYQETFGTSSKSVSDLTAKLNQITRKMERVKQETQERQEQMSDSKPLVNIKKALGELKTEIKTMELRIGVLQHTVLHQTMKQSAGNTADKEESAAAEDTGI